MALRNSTEVKLDDVSPVLDLPGADFGEFGGENVGGPFVAEHHGVFGVDIIFGHCLGELGTHGLLGPPNTWDVNRPAELLHHFFAAIVANNNNSDTSCFAIFNPFN